jgi:hypothetical protein
VDAKGSFVESKLINCILFWASAKFAVKVIKVMNSINNNDTEQLYVEIEELKIRIKSLKVEMKN